MRAGLCPRLFRAAAAAAAVTAAAVPPNYSNIPYQRSPKKRHDKSHMKKKDSTQFTTTTAAPLSSVSSSSCAPSPASRLAASLLHEDAARRSAILMSMGEQASLTARAILPPAPMRSTFIDPSQDVANIRSTDRVCSLRRSSTGTADVSMRPLQFLQFDAAAGDSTRNSQKKNEAQKRMVERSNTFGERLRDQLSCRWAAKFYGQVTFGPRNYPYPSSRWLARRFKMKKHKIVKRFRFRRYKLAAVANLPFAKMIRVGMLPELKSSKTKKGDAVEAGLSSQLVSAAKSSVGGKTKGRRSRPKSKYQV